MSWTVNTSVLTWILKAKSSANLVGRGCLAFIVS